MVMVALCGEESGPERFRKKPVEVEAMRLTWDNLPDVKAWCGGNVAYGCGVAIGLTIATREGFMLGELGDWIVKEPFPTADRRFYPCKPELFDATYESLAPHPLLYPERPTK